MSKLREPMFLLLLACGTLYLLLGDVQEALMLLGFVFVVLGITFYQERKTERALEALRELSSPRALVIRDGLRKRIAHWTWSFAGNQFSIGSPYNLFVCPSWMAQLSRCHRT